ncbi:MAG: transposase [Candidatus Poribacteria bacterium]|nr:transposase [Candidatus Poribacteria bacterium]
MFETVRSTQRYKSSRHTIFACDYHIIWCTKYRRQVLTNAVQERLKEIIMEKQEDYNY